MTYKTYQLNIIKRVHINTQYPEFHRGSKYLWEIANVADCLWFYYSLNLKLWVINIHRTPVPLPSSSLNVVIRHITLLLCIMHMHVLPVKVSAVVNITSLARISAAAISTISRWRINQVYLGIWKYNYTIPPLITIRNIC